MYQMRFIALVKYSELTPSTMINAFKCVMPCKIFKEFTTVAFLCIIAEDNDLKLIVLGLCRLGYR